MGFVWTSVAVWNIHAVPRKQTDYRKITEIMDGGAQFCLEAPLRFENRFFRQTGFKTADSIVTMT